MSKFSTFQLIKEVYNRVGLRSWELAAVVVLAWVFVTKLG